MLNLNLKFKCATVVALFLILCQLPPAAAQIGNEERVNAKLKELETKLASKKKIYYCVKPIAKGEAIRSDQITEAEVMPRKMPVDCWLLTAPITGRKPMFDIQEGQIISQRDFNIALNPSQNAALLARNYGNTKEPMGTIVFNKVALVKGALIRSEQLGEAPMPLDAIAQDAINNAALVAGRKSKFDKAKLQIMMQHELFSP